MEGAEKSHWQEMLRNPRNSHGSTAEVVFLPPPQPGQPSTVPGHHTFFTRLSSQDMNSREMSSQVELSD